MLIQRYRAARIVDWETVVATLNVAAMVSRPRSSCRGGGASAWVLRVCICCVGSGGRVWLGVVGCGSVAGKRRRGRCTTRRIAGSCWRSPLSSPLGLYGFWRGWTSMRSGADKTSFLTAFGVAGSLGRAPLPRLLPRLRHRRAAANQHMAEAVAARDQVVRRRRGDTGSTMGVNGSSRNMLHGVSTPPAGSSMPSQVSSRSAAARWRSVLPAAAR